MIFIYKKAILYTIGCPNCKKLELMLKKHEVVYTVNDSKDEMLALGFTTVPILQIDGENMEYAEAVEWINKYFKGGNE